MSGNVNQSPGASVQQKPATFADMIRSLEARILSLGSGQHTDKQKEELKNLNLLLVKTREQAKLAGQKVEPSTLPATAVTSGATVTTASSASAASGTSSSSATSLSQITQTAAMLAAQTNGEPRVLEKKRLQELIREVDPTVQVEDDVDEALMQIADDFIDNVVNSACELAKHRKSDSLEVKDVQLHLARAWNMWIPGFGSEELRPHKKAPTAEAHKQRLALIKKTMKKN